MKTSLKTLLKALVSFFILFFLLYRIGFVEIYNTFLTFNLAYLPLLIIILVVSLILGALNIKIIFHSLNTKINTALLLLEYTRSWSISLILPGKIGTLSLIYLLRKSVSIAKTSVVLFIDTMITYGIILIIFAIGWLKFFSIESSFKILGLIAAAAVFLAFLFTKNGRYLISKYILRRHAAKFKGFSKDLFGFLKHKKPVLFLNIVITIIKVNLNALSPLVGLMALGLKVPYTYVLIIYAITIVVSGIPISISGLGVRESVGVFLYSQIGVNPEISAVMFISIVLINYFVALLSFWSTDYLKKIMVQN